MGQEREADSLAKAFLCLASLCEANKKVICGLAPGCDTYWSSFESWIALGRKAVEAELEADRLTQALPAESRILTTKDE